MRRPRLHARPAPQAGAPRLVAVALAAGLAALPSSCSGSSEPPLPPSPPIITVVMTEYNFAYKLPIPAGQVIFRMVNSGHMDHQPELLPLSDKVPPILEQVRGTTRVAVAPFAGVRDLKPGQVGAFAVLLDGGMRYAFVDFARAPSGKTDASLGMATEFRPVAP